MNTPPPPYQEPLNLPGKQVSLKLNGWWGKRSAYIHPDCGLYKLKKAFIDELLKQKLIEEKDIDSRNTTAHIALRENESDGDALYNQLHNTTLNLTTKSCNISDSFVDVNVGPRHCTLFYKKGLFSMIPKDKTRELFATALAAV